jgi:hypothetical protein
MTETREGERGKSGKMGKIKRTGDKLYGTQVLPLFFAVVFPFSFSVFYCPGLRLAACK